VAKAHGHEVQGFFCPGPEIDHDGVNGHSYHYNPTSSGNAIAVKMADNSTIVLMRDPSTRARNPDAEWTNQDAMYKGSPNIVKIIKNGEVVKFEDIGTGGSSSADGNNYALGSKVDKEKAREEDLGDSSFVSQLATKGSEGQHATSPVCVGDETNNFLVDFSVPVLKGRWPLVYEASVTVFAKQPVESGSKTLCGDQAMQGEIKRGQVGYVNNPSRYDVPLDKVLFTSAQIAELCTTCNMKRSDSSLCTDTSKDSRHVAHHKSFCDSKEYSWDAAETSCSDSGVPDDSPWYERCVIEQCASKGAGATLMKAEMEFTAWLEQVQRR